MKDPAIEKTVEKTPSERRLSYRSDVAQERRGSLNSLCSRRDSWKLERRFSNASSVGFSGYGTANTTYAGSFTNKRSSLSDAMNLVVAKAVNVDDEIRESRKNNTIFILRLLMIFSLLVATAAVSSITYLYSRNAEVNEFERQYEDSVVKVEDAIIISVNNKINTAKTFSAIYTSRYGTSHIWPNTTMLGTDFIEQAVGLLEIANGIALSFNPIIVQNVTRSEFEAHATENAHILGAEELVNRSCDTCRVVADGIFRKAPSPADPETLISVDDPGYFPESRFPYHLVPVWQIYPTATNWRAVMFNLHSETNRQRALDDMLEYDVPTLTALLHLVQHDVMNPSSILFYPVFDKFLDYSNTTKREIVGSISIVFIWEDVLRKVLPGYIEGMIVVLESSASYLPRQLWTYDVSGERVTILGEGDLHDSKFDSFEYLVNINVASNSNELGNVDYLITYQLRIYPSEKFQSKYLTMKPIVMTLVVILVFLLTSIIFRLYDWLVNHRQKQIMDFATKSGKIVDSLFPASVRDRLFDNAEKMHEQLNGDKTMAFSIQNDSDNNVCRNANDSDSEKLNSSHKAIANKMRAFIFHRRDSLSSSNTERVTEMQSLNTPPIADLFTNTSIMFCDIVGFTKWSSEHSPEEVFHLLETLFLEFDRLATRLKVFKLGTIGDCYIAVTGIPDETYDHAVTLCRYAEGCRKKVESVFAKLDPILGGVNALSLRFGIHSGEVTAGVLRGQKSRFELFGDTMNTASRMESNSLPGEIQISAETARLVSEVGLEHWLTPRKDKIKAKGKGNLQTYWLNIKPSELALEKSAANNIEKYK